VARVTCIGDVISNVIPSTRSGFFDNFEENRRKYLRYS